jgi:transposase InsO family protein
VAEVIAFMDDHRGEHGVEPMCRVLNIAPSTWHAHAAARANPDLRSKRAQEDERLSAAILRVHAENFGVYGARKVWRQLLREGFDAGRDRVARLMRRQGLEGVRRGRRVRTTLSDKTAPCPLDKVNRHFTADRPNRLWVGDFTYVPTWAGMVYVAFVIDVFARRIVGWRASQTASAQFVLDALEQAVHMRRPTEPGLIHHSDRGVQYVSIKYTERLAEAGIEPSVGSVGDSYDNALAETVIGLFKTEVIHRQGPWRGLAAVEIATMDWVDWYNTRRLLGSIGDIPPVEAEANHHAALEATPMAA